MNSTLFHCHRMSVEETLSWPAHTPSRHHIKISWQIKILAQEARSATQLEKENRTRLHTDNEVQLQKRWYRSSLNKYFLETSSIIFEWINADKYGRTTFYKQKWNRGSTLRKQVNLLQLFALMVWQQLVTLHYCRLTDSCRLSISPIPTSSIPALWSSASSTWQSTEFDSEVWLAFNDWAYLQADIHVWLPFHVIMTLRELLFQCGIIRFDVPSLLENGFFPRLIYWAIACKIGYYCVYHMYASSHQIYERNMLVSRIKVVLRQTRCSGVWEEEVIFQ